jgi:hypothetical protein
MQDEVVPVDNDDVSLGPEERFEFGRSKPRGTRDLHDPEPGQAAPHLAPVGSE